MENKIPLYHSWKDCVEICTIDWNSLLSDDIDVSWSNWHHQFMLIMEDCIPKVTIPGHSRIVQIRSLLSHGKFLPMHHTNVLNDQETSLNIEG